MTNGNEDSHQRLVRRLCIWKKTEDTVTVRWQEKEGEPIPYNRTGEGRKFKNGWRWRQKTLPRCNQALREHQRKLETEAVYL